MNDASAVFDEIRSDPELNEQLKRLVLQRVSVIPDTLQMAVGELELTKEDVAKHVRAEDDIGQQIMEMELNFLRAVASGAVYARE